MATSSFTCPSSFASTSLRRSRTHSGERVGLGAFGPSARTVRTYEADEPPGRPQRSCECPELETTKAVRRIATVGVRVGTMASLSTRVGLCADQAGSCGKAGKMAIFPPGDSPVSAYIEIDVHSLRVGCGLTTTTSRELHTSISEDRHPCLPKA